MRGDFFALLHIFKRGIDSDSTYGGPPRNFPIGRYKELDCQLWPKIQVSSRIDEENNLVAHCTESAARQRECHVGKEASTVSLDIHISSFATY